MGKGGGWETSIFEPAFVGASPPGAKGKKVKEKDNEKVGEERRGHQLINS